MSLQREFEIFLDHEWQLWRDPKNVGNPRYHQMRKAFMAGYTVGAKGPSAKALAADSEPVNVFSLVNSSSRKFKAPGDSGARKLCTPSRVARYKAKERPRCNGGRGCDRCDAKWESLNNHVHA